ncbi:MAG: PEP-CTERM sorting domain-containing protein [Desulfobacterales bacterium]|jgi:hypothetical protein
MVDKKEIKMRKVLVLICLAALILGMVGIVGASPFTDSIYMANKLSGAGDYTWEHDPYHNSGGPNSVAIAENLGITAWLVSDMDAITLFSGNASGGQNEGSWSPTFDGWAGVGIEDVLVNWNAIDPLKIRPANENMKSSKLLSSILSLRFSVSSTPTPEPANLLILGLGLIGVSILGRKKLTSKTHRVWRS